jgi:hemoglobin-like flavoprotein
MAVDFYRRLFAIDPSAEALFSEEPTVMAEKFAAELEAIVEAIVSFDVFSARVHDLAARRRDPGEALIGALAAHLGPDWTPTLESAWRRAYNLVAELMMATTADLG